MRILLNFATALSIVLSGCGYTTGSLLPSNIKTIYIENFQNKVGYLNDAKRSLYIPLLEVKVHDSIVNRFQFDGHLKNLRSPTADLIIKGSLIGFEREELRVAENNVDVLEYRIRITIAIELIDGATAEQVWAEPSFSGEATYQLTGPTAKTEDAALQDALEDLSRRVVERTLENW